MTTPLPVPLFDYPPQAAFEKVLPKTKIYAHATPGRRVQRHFTEQVARIVWQYKLAPETVRLPARQGIEEIQVLRVALKEGVGDNLASDVLQCIDKAIPHPLLFELVDGARVRAVAAYKRPNEADRAKWVLGEYFLSDWHPIDVKRAPLPVAVDLAALYRELLRRLMPHPPRDGELLRDHAERVGRIKTLQREHEKLLVRLGREPQFNRKVEINQSVRALQSELDELTQALATECAS